MLDDPGRDEIVRYHKSHDPARRCSFIYQHRKMYRRQTECGADPSDFFVSSDGKEVWMLCPRHMKGFSPGKKWIPVAERAIDGVVAAIQIHGE